MSGYFLGEIRPFGFAFPPKGWALCAGQLLSIQQNTALFSLLGTTYGGNGVTTFQLPDLRGRGAVAFGTSNLGSTYNLGQIGGTETVTLISTQLPMHNHFITATADTGDAPLPQPQAGPPPNYLAAPDHSVTGQPDEPVKAFAPTGTLVPLQTTLGTNGGNQPHANMQPYLVVSYCIALTGIFPSRN